MKRYFQDWIFGIRFNYYRYFGGKHQNGQMLVLLLIIAIAYMSMKLGFGYRHAGSQKLIPSEADRPYIREHHEGTKK